MNNFIIWDNSQKGDGNFDFLKEFQKFDSNLKRVNLKLSVFKQDLKITVEEAEKYRDEFETVEEFISRKTDEIEKIKLDVTKEEAKLISQYDISKRIAFNTSLGNQEIHIGKYDIENESFTIEILKKSLGFKVIVNIIVPRTEAKEFKLNNQGFSIYFNSKMKIEKVVSNNGGYNLKILKENSFNKSKGYQEALKSLREKENFEMYIRLFKYSSSFDSLALFADYNLILVEESQEKVDYDDYYLTEYHQERSRKKRYTLKKKIFKVAFFNDKYSKLCDTNCCSREQSIKNEQIGDRGIIKTVCIGRSYGDNDYKDVEERYSVYNTQQICIKPVSGREFYIEPILKNG